MGPRSTPPRDIAWDLYMQARAQRDHLRLELRALQTAQRGALLVAAASGAVMGAGLTLLLLRVWL